MFASLGAVHVIFDAAAAIAGFWYYLRLRSRTADPIPEEHRWLILAGACVGGWIGSRALAWAEHPSEFLKQPILYYVEEKTVIGFLIGAILGVEIAKTLIGQRMRSGDLFTFPLILGIMIGRVGCLLAGVADGTAGSPSTLPWAFDQGDGVARHPTSLYEIAFLGLLWCALRRFVTRVSLPPGHLFRMFVASYFTFRFAIEFVKPVHPVWFGLSAIQIACAVVTMFYLVELLRQSAYTVKNPIWRSS